MYGRDNSYHHPSLLPSSPRCFLLFSSRWFIRVRAPLWPPCVVVVEVEKKRRKKNENQYSDRNALERERHAGCQHRRVVDTFCSKKGGGGSPCRLSQLTCSVFLFYFRRFLFCARHATPHVPPPPPLSSTSALPLFRPCRAAASARDPRTEAALCFDHVTPPARTRSIVGSPPG